jgi:hypothetical protein
MIFIIGEDLVKKMFYSKYNLKKKIKMFFFYLKKKKKMLVILVIDGSIVQFVVVVAVIVAAVVDFRISILRWCVQHAPRLRHGLDTSNEHTTESCKRSAFSFSSISFSICMGFSSYCCYCSSLLLLLLSLLLSSS